MIFERIVKLFESIQPIRRKYPMVVSYLNHLKRPIDDRLKDADRKSEEVYRFKQYLLKNSDLESKIISDWYYDGTMKSSTICFENVVKLGTDTVVSDFWENLIEIAKLSFPDGIKTEIQRISQLADTASSADSAVQTIADASNGSLDSDTITKLLETNPFLTGYLDDIKQLVENSRGGDMASIFTSKEFQKVAKKLTAKMTGELQSGKLQFSDIGNMLQTLMGVAKTTIDPSLTPHINNISTVLSGLEIGTPPDPEMTSKMVDMLRYFNVNG